MSSCSLILLSSLPFSRTPTPQTPLLLVISLQGGEDENLVRICALYCCVYYCCCGQKQKQTFLAPVITRAADETKSWHMPNLILSCPVSLDVSDASERGSKSIDRAIVILRLGPDLSIFSMFPFCAPYSLAEIIARSLNSVQTSTFLVGVTEIILEVGIEPGLEITDYIIHKLKF